MGKYYIIYKDSQTEYHCKYFTTEAINEIIALEKFREKHKYAVFMVMYDIAVHEQYPFTANVASGQ